MVKKACQEGIQIVENCGENRLKNSIFDNVLLKTMFYLILQPFWTVLARFWDIWGHFWVHLRVTKAFKIQQGANSTQQGPAPGGQEGPGRLPGTIFGGFGMLFS